MKSTEVWIEKSWWRWHTFPPNGYCISNFIALVQIPAKNPVSFSLTYAVSVEWHKMKNLDRVIHITVLMLYTKFHLYCPNPRQKTNFRILLSAGFLRGGIKRKVIVVVVHNLAYKIFTTLVQVPAKKPFFDPVRFFRGGIKWKVLFGEVYIPV